MSFLLHLCLSLAILLPASALAPSGAYGGVGDYDYCTVSGPCAEGEGDCDGNSECRAGLVCVQDQGAHYWNFPAPSAGYDPSIVDVCEAPDPDLCTDYGPCPAGNGDCDSDSECQVGLACVDDVGARYGYPAHYDVCEAQSGGGSGQGRPGHADYCRDYGPCSAGQGDCDPGQCASGLVCANDVGARYGLPAHYDVCEAQSGGGSGQGRPGHVDYCRDYGPCSVGQGDCDGNSECQSGLECVQDVGANYGLPADYDVCETSSGGGDGGDGQDPCPTDDSYLCTNPSAPAAGDGCIEIDGPFGGFNVADYEWRNTCGRRVVMKAVCSDQKGERSPHITTQDGVQTYTWRRGFGLWTVPPYGTYPCILCDRCADRDVEVTWIACYDSDPNDGVADPVPYPAGDGQYVCVN